MIAYCPRCGADLQFRVLGPELGVTGETCADCHLTVAEPAAMLAPSDDEIEYDLAEWPVGDRGSATGALSRADIPYRWTADLVLVVPAVAEEEVDVLLDELDEVGEAADADPPADGYEADDDEADGGEEAQAAMSDLFVATDRLQHAPDDSAVAADVTLAASVVRASAPPYGIDRRTWRQIQALATAVVADLEEDADDELIVSDARAARDFLRDFV